MSLTGGHMIKGTSILRESNEKRILKLLRNHEAETRQDLVKRTGLGKNTVSVIIERFLKEGIVEELGIMNENKVGRPKRIISLIASAIKEIGIAIEREYIKFAVLDYRLEEIRVITVDNPTPSEIDSVIELLKKNVTLLVQEFPEVIGVGISAPGIIDTERGIVEESTQLGWSGVPLAKLVRQFFSGIVEIINTVKALSLINGVSDSHSIFYVRIRNGIGGSFIQNGKITYGNSWIAGEVGQIPIVSEFGEEIHLEEAVNSNTVRKQMAADNPKEVLCEKGKLMGRFISTIIFMCNPEIILIDAFYCKEPAFEKSVRKYLSENISDYLLQETQIDLNYFELKLSERGAALIVIDAFENISFEQK